jgi:hypothetical protein
VSAAKGENAITKHNIRANELLNERLIMTTSLKIYT